MQLDSVKIVDLNQFQRVLGERKPGEKVELEIYRRRAGKLRLKISLGETPKTTDLPNERDLF